eukprot:6178720-Pleurochrysis_carterae.AAC.3
MGWPLSLDEYNLPCCALPCCHQHHCSSQISAVWRRFRLLDPFVRPTAALSLARSCRPSAAGSPGARCGAPRCKVAPPSPARRARNWDGRCSGCRKQPQSAGKRIQMEEHPCMKSTFETNKHQKMFILSAYFAEGTPREVLPFLSYRHLT